MTDSTLEMNEKLFKVVTTIRKQLGEKSGLNEGEQLLVTGYLFAMVLLETEGDDDVHPRDTFVAGMDLLNNALYSLEGGDEEDEEGKKGEAANESSGVLSALPSSS